MERFGTRIHFTNILIMFVLTLQCSMSFSEILCSDLFQNSKLSINNELSMLFTPERIYVTGEAKSQNIIFLTSDQYEQAIKNESIPVDAILVLDKLPLTDDLPLVSGVIISKELEMEDTHIQLLANKIGIVLVYISGAYENRELRNIADQKKSFLLNCIGIDCRVVGSDQMFISKIKRQSILPLELNRTKKKIYMADYNLPPREYSGDKFFSLVKFKLKFPHLVPDIIALSSGFYEEFLNNYQSNGISLRELQKNMIQNFERANQINDENQIKYMLKQFREQVLSSVISSDKASNVFSEISKLLKTYYDGILFSKSNLPYSGRSNNSEEEYLGAGLYKSSVFSSLSPKDIENSFKKIWSSLYDYRAYAVRRYWGQKEENLSMPIMVHPYIDNVNYHAVGSFKLDPVTDNIELAVNMVFGKTEKATNPTARAEKIQLIVKRNKLGSIELNEQVSVLKNKLPRGTKNIIISFYKEVEDFIRSEFATRSLTPQNINIEFVVLKSFLNLAPSILVLQYKANLNKEVVISILNGEVNRKLADKKIDLKKIIEFGIFSNTNKKTIEYNKAYRLDEISSEQTELLMKRLNGNIGSFDIRYALMYDNQNQEPFLVFWQGAFHRAIKANIETTQYQWVLSGYLSIRNQMRQQSQIYFSFKEIIGETSSEEVINEVDPDAIRDINLSERLFRSAWSITLEKNRAFLDLVKKNDIKQVKFFIEEGGFQINLKP